MQELDLHIHYSPGHKNGNADALSRYPMEAPAQSGSEIRPVATIRSGVIPAEGGDPGIADRQELDTSLAPI